MSPSSRVVLGIDLGTTRVKVIAFDPELGRIVASFGQDYPTTVTPDGGSEQNPDDWWRAVTAGCQQLLSVVKPEIVSAVGLSGHMHGLLLLDDKMNPVHPAMTWSDRRVGAQTEALRTNSRFREVAGNDVVDAFTAPKLAWLSTTHPETLRKASHLVLAKDYLAFRLTGLLGTDTTDAIGTLLWDVKNKSWDAELFDDCGASSTLAPLVVDSSSVRGTVTQTSALETGLRAGTPVVAGAGDVSAAALGAGLVDSSVICLNAGTAAQAMGSVTTLDAGEGFIFGNALGPGFVAMSSVYAAGASVRWVEKALLSSTPIESLDNQFEPGSDGLTYLPFMFGAVVPRKNDQARAAFVGQSSSHGSSHFASAVLEGIAFACADAIEAIINVTGEPEKIHVVGGVANSRVWKSALASVLEAPIFHLPDGGSAIGAAILAAIGAGVSSQEEVLDSLARSEVSRPNPEAIGAYREARTRFVQARDSLV